MKLIINADDYGLTKTCTHAIVQAFEKKHIDRTTMCANGYYFDEACKLAGENKLLDKIGIHINLIEGEPLTEAIKNDSLFCDQNGYFEKKINRFSFLNKKRRKMVYEEVSAQIDKMRKAGFNIEHADSHYHAHTYIAILPIVIKVLKEKNINSLRIYGNFGTNNFIKLILKHITNLYIRIHKFDVVDYFGGVSCLDYLKKCKSDKSYEIMVHPDFNSDNELIDRISYIDKAPIGSLLETQIGIIRGKLK